MLKKTLLIIGLLIFFLFFLKTSVNAQLTCNRNPSSGTVNSTTFSVWGTGSAGTNCKFEFGGGASIGAQNGVACTSSFSFTYTTGGTKTPKITNNSTGAIATCSSITVSTPPTPTPTRTPTPTPTRTPTPTPAPPACSRSPNPVQTGQTFSVTGSNFGPVAVCQFGFDGGATTGPISATCNSTVQTTYAPGSAGTKFVTITRTDGGGSGSAACPSTTVVEAPTPTPTPTSPPPACSRSPNPVNTGQTVSVTGSNFGSVAQCRFGFDGGAVTGPIDAACNTTQQTSYSSGSAGNKTITITRTDGGGSGSATCPVLTVNEGPTPTPQPGPACSASPNPVNTGQTVSVTGSNFGPSAICKFEFGGGASPGPINNVPCNSTQQTSYSFGSGNVTKTIQLTRTDGGGGGSASCSVVVNEGPTPTSAPKSVTVSPNPVVVGASVSVTGSGFGSGATDCKFEFGGGAVTGPINNVPCNSTQSTQYTSGSTGTKIVSVTNNANGNSASTSLTVTGSTGTASCNVSIITPTPTPTNIPNCNTSGPCGVGCCFGFVCNVSGNCVTPTPTPTPGPSPWIKLRDTTFAGVNPLNNEIPSSVLAFDNEDTTDPYFIVSSTNSDPGEVTAESINLGAGTASSVGWTASGVDFNPKTTIASYIDYVKARKDYVNITGQPLNQAISSGNTIYYAQGNQNIYNMGMINPSTPNVVIIVDGNLDISANGVMYNPSNNPVAFLVRGNLNFNSSVTDVTGIFIVQGQVNTGSSSSSQPLKITGNLFALGGVNNNRILNDNRRPSVFVVFSPGMYRSILPYLSLRTYDWRQLACKGTGCYVPGEPTPTPPGGGGPPATNTPTPTLTPTPTPSQNTLTISADFDGFVYVPNSSCTAGSSNFGTMYVGEGNSGSSESQRVYLRFPLTNLPTGATITDVKLNLNVLSLGSAGGTLSTDIQAYNSNGQPDPSSDACATRGTRTKDDTTPYVDNTTVLRTTGLKTIQLPVAANTDIMTAKTTVNRFSLGLNEDSTPRPAFPGNAIVDLEAISDPGANEAKLVITYQ